MPVKVKFGKLPAQQDDRIPRLSLWSRGRLPPPPSVANWWTIIGPDQWEMLGNDIVGDCTCAAVQHCVMQFSAAAGAELKATTEETLAAYSAITGYDPTKTDSSGYNPTDNGAYMIGPNGVIPYWVNTGFTTAGVNTKCVACLRILRKNGTEWREAVYYFGGLLLGFKVPESLVSGSSIPGIWRDFSPPYVGGHEIWINGYDTTSKDGQVLYDLVSWGNQYRCTEEFLLNVMDEALCVVDPVEINSRGVDFGGLSLAQLITDMKLIKGDRVAVV